MVSRNFGTVARKLKFSHTINLSLCSYSIVVKLYLSQTTKEFIYKPDKSICMSLKQVILVRHDLKLPKGKACSQVAHASTESLLRSHKDDITKWRAEGMKKVVLKVADEKELIKYKNLAEDHGLVTALITDAGRTVVEPGTITCLGIGPDKEEKIDKVTGHLKMV